MGEDNLDEADLIQEMLRAIHRIFSIPIGHYTHNGHKFRFFSQAEHLHLW